MAEKHNYKPPNGYVPDAETAIRIAIAVWEPIYGNVQIQGQAPFSGEKGAIALLLHSLVFREPCD